MPNRILKESIWTSPNLNAVSEPAELLFYRLLPAPDDNGCFEATPLVVKGKCFPLRDKVKITDLEKWYAELEQADLIRFWSVGGRKYGFFPNWEKHQRIRSVHQRKTPIPPDDVTCRQVSSDDGLNPNLNPNLNLNKIVGSSDPALIPTKEEINESAIPKVKDDLTNLTETLYREGIFPDAPKFKNAMLKKKINPRAILHALIRCYTKRPTPEEAWGYCLQILKVEDGNYNERDSTKAY